MDQSWKVLDEIIDPVVLNAVSSLNFVNMTPVQAACIPQFVRHKDMAVEAVTGSGKTLAFVVPIMHMLAKRETKLKKHEVGAIILTPTRELAFQIQEVVSHFLKFQPQFTSYLVIGGVKPEADINHLTNKGANILIATPGRLEDLLQRKIEGLSLPTSVKALEVLVLDEADRLLDMGFEASINTILSYLPKLRRTGLFSATQTDEVKKLIRAGLRNPMQITVKEKPSAGAGSTGGSCTQRTPQQLRNYYMYVPAENKLSQLVAFLSAHKKEKIMLFFSTCACVDYFSKCLQGILKNTQFLAIHSKMKSKRNNIFSEFRNMKSGVLVCTDVMARGVDIPEVGWVIQYDPPSSASAFVHRCGRTARIGNQGNALVLLLPTEDAYVEFIEMNQRVPLTQMEAPQVADVRDVTPRVQTLAVRDRAVYEKGLRAFVSHIQAYQKHECKLILRLKDLDFGRLAHGFGLIHLPKMPELKNKDVTYFTPLELDLNSIAFKDKIREKARQERQEKEGQIKKVKFRRPPKTEPWSKIKDKKEKKQKRKEKKQKNKHLKRKAEPEEEEEEVESDGLDDDIRLIKKLKRGKISKEDFDKQFAGEISD